MPYGTIKVDNIVFTNGGVDATVTVSGLNAATSGNLTVTGTISGTTVNAVTGTFTTSLSGATITGNTGQFSNITGVSGTFTTNLSGTTITGNTGQFSNLTSVSGTFTTRISGATITGNTGQFTSGVFTSISGTTVNITSGVFASGTEAAPSVSVGTTTNGLYSPGTNQVAISTSGTGRVFVDSAGKVGIGIPPSQILDIYRATAGQAIIKLSDANSRSVEFRSPDNTGAIAGIGSTTNHDFAVFTGNVEKIRITSTGSVNIVGAGTAGSTQAVSFSGSAPVDSLVVTSAGRVGVGIANPGSKLEIQGLGSASGYTSAGNAGIKVDFGTANNGVINLVGGGDLGIYHSNSSGAYDVGISFGDNSNRILRFDTAGGEKMRLDASGNLGLGVTPSVNWNLGKALEIGTSTGNVLWGIGINATSLLSNGYYNSGYKYANAGYATRYDCGGGNGTHAWHIAGSGTKDASITFTQAMTLDASGNLGIGETSPTARLYVTGLSTQGYFNFKGGSANGGYGAFMNNNGTIIGYLGNGGGGALSGGTSTDFVVRATNNLLFSKGNSETARIDSSGNFLIGKTTNPGDITTDGTDFGTGYGIFTRPGGTPLFINRKTDDGILVALYQDTVLEGSISVSGTTVSYNGAHLSRWSQLPGGAIREEILRGTVLSNIDEMCGWSEEDNEQLNRMKVSDVEGDPNVAGVFQAWDDDDDTYTDDFYCAMTGDFIIRIAEGVTVQRGDLLMSAGDGTAKPQDDDIIRSKTVAKVISTHVTCTYDDGSYCVPCVLMAC